MASESELIKQSSMEKVAGIEDLLIEILLRLPVRSLLSFKLVSEHWRILISSPQFCARKSKRCCKHISGILLTPRSMKDSHKFDFVPLDPDQPAPLKRLSLVNAKGLEGLHIIQSCNGLLLCRPKEYSFPKTKYYVINPTTGHSVTVSQRICQGTFYHAALAFDPRKSPHFKLVCLFWRDSTFCVRVYSSETHSVTRSGGCFHKFEGSVAAPNECVYWNGAINWISSDCHGGLYVNVDEERFGKFSMPAQNASRRISYFGESNDRLYLSLTDTATQHLDVYEMDREYSGWLVKFRVDLQPMFTSYPTTTKRSNKAFSILAVVDEDDGENSFIVFARPGKAIQYHLKKSVFTKICDFSGVRADGGLPLYSRSESIQYIESLAKPILGRRDVPVVLGPGVTGP